MFWKGLQHVVGATLLITSGATLHKVIERIPGGRAGPTRWGGITDPQAAPLHALPLGPGPLCRSLANLGLPSGRSQLDLIISQSSSHPLPGPSSLSLAWRRLEMQSLRVAPGRLN